MVRGLACTIDLAPLGGAQTASFDFNEASDMAPAQFLSRFDQGTETLNIAVTRFNHIGQTLSGFTPIGTVNIVVVVEEVGGDGLELVIGGTAMQSDGTLANTAINSFYQSSTQGGGGHSIEALNVSANVTHANCSYLGTAALQISGGVEPYDIQWSTGATTEYIVNLEPEMYSVTVTDDGDSEVIIDFEVEDHYLTEDEEGNPIECNPVLLLEPEEDRKGRKEAQDENTYLQQNHPNPFSQTTTIPYDIPEDAKNPVLNIFDVTGNLKYTTPVHQTGEGEIQISQHRLPTGIYYYQLKMDERISATRKMIIVR